MVLSLADAAFVTTPTNALWNRAGAYPTLDLRFADSKSLVDAVSGQNLITFTRSGDATYVDSDGLIKTAGTNVPRFDHNPTTGECLGLLVEEQRTNLLLRSEEFDNAQWVKRGTCAIVSNDAISPSGTLTADKITFAGSGNDFYYSGLNVAAGTAVSPSVYIKKITATGTFKFNSASNSTSGEWTVDLSKLSAGWERLTVSHPSVTVVTPFTGSGNNFSGFQVFTSTGSTIEAYFWGAQLEAGAFPTSYIPTTSSAVTRNADVADIINTALANGIRTLYAEFRSPASGTRGVASLNDNSVNQRSAIITSGTDPRLVVVDGGVTQADIDAGTIAANTRSRMVVRINANDFSASFNGGAVVTDTSGTVPTVDRLFLGRTQAGEYLNAPIARLIGWTQALPDATLQSITQ